MSLIITSTPASLSSVHGNLIYTVTETVKTADPVTYPDYKFIAEVYVGDELVATLKKVPQPDTKVGIFNIGQVVRNYFTTRFDPTPTGVLTQRMGEGEFFIEVTVDFGEEYDFTEYLSVTSDSPRLFFNNYNFKGFTSSLTGFSDKVLSDRPLTTPVRCDSNFNFIPYLPSTTTLFQVTVRTYNWGDSLVATINYDITPTAAYELQLVNLARGSINTANPGTISSYIKYYTAEFNHNGTLYRFDMNCECTYEIFTLHFLNKYGGFETKDFAKVSRKSIQMERKDFGKLAYTVDPSGVVSYKSANNVYNESRSTYSVTWKEKLVLNSDLLTDDEYIWLQQLITSPMVFLEEDGSFYPVVITDTNYEPKKAVNDELTNLTINIELGEQLNAQFR